MQLINRHSAYMEYFMFIMDNMLQKLFFADWDAVVRRFLFAKEIYIIFLMYVRSVELYFTIGRLSTQMKMNFVAFIAPVTQATMKEKLDKLAVDFIYLYSQN